MSNKPAEDLNCRCIPPANCDICGRPVTIDLAGAEINAEGHQAIKFKDGHMNLGRHYICQDCGTVHCNDCARLLFALEVGKCRACRNWAKAAAAGDLTKHQIRARAQKVRAMRGRKGSVDWSILPVLILATFLLGSIFGAVLNARAQQSRPLTQPQAIKTRPVGGSAEPARTARARISPYRRPAHAFGILGAIRQHESLVGSRRILIGDGGLARGQMMTHQGTWNDGLEILGLRHHPDWQWPQATNETWRSYVVAIAHYQRYIPADLEAGTDIELFARTWRLPADPYRDDPAQDRYWQAVKNKYWSQGR